MSNRRVSETRTLGGWLQSAAMLDQGNMHVQPVENLAKAGTPDREGYVRGVGQFWVELKVADRPVRSSSIVGVHFQPGQATWLRKRWAFGGSAWLLCQVGSSHHARRYLFKGSLAAHIEEGVPEQWMVKHCEVSPRGNARLMLYRMALGQGRRFEDILGALPVDLRAFLEERGGSLK